MSYLLSLHYAPVQINDVTGLCTIGDNISCFEVNKSVYSQVFGIPISLLGLLYFSAVFIAVFLKPSPRQLGILSLITIAFLGPSFYLSVIEATVLYKWCLYCELSKFFMICIAVLSWLESRNSRPSKGELFLSVTSALLLAMVTFYIHL